MEVVELAKASNEDPLTVPFAAMILRFRGRSSVYETKFDIELELSDKEKVVKLPSIRLVIDG